MTQLPAKPPHESYLAVQLRWLMQLRWLAGLCVILIGIIDLKFLHVYEHPTFVISIGLAIVAYNAVLLLSFRALVRGRNDQNRLQLHAWTQLLADMACLSMLATRTGGVYSPVVCVFGFHMVFASLLLPAITAYGAAGAGSVLLSGGLYLSGNWPQGPRQMSLLITTVSALFLTVFLANHITDPLRRQRRRLMKQNRRIRAITHQLKKHQHNLIQHEKMVALGQMAAGVTHEITNPLASMDSLLQLMQRRPERLRPDAVGTLREQVDRIMGVIQQMKAFAHPQETERQILPVNEIVDRAIEMERFDKRIRRVTIDRQYDPNVGSIQLLPQAMQQVLINLMGNALDAMTDVPEPRLVVRTMRRDGHVVIELEDNGHGIKNEHLDRLFEPFFTTKPVGKGTGLGLSISYSLIKKQGGSISVRSSFGQGCTFTIRLPASTEPSRERESTSPVAAVSEKNPS
jgi:signal transduction histidine kinase